MKSPEFYIYFWLRTDGTPYYIGKGKSDRAFVKHHPISKPTCNTRIKIFLKDLTEPQAFAFERFWIKVFGRKDLQTGILYNRTDGGEGGSGSFRTPETRQKMAAWQRGRTLTEQHKKNVRKMNDTTVDQIIKLHKEHFSPYKIKEMLDLDVSVRTIYNVLKRELEQ